MEITSAVVFAFVWVLKSDALVKITVCIKLNPLKMSERNRNLETGMSRGSLKSCAISGAEKKSATYRNRLIARVKGKTVLYSSVLIFLRLSSARPNQLSMRSDEKAAKMSNEPIIP